MENFNNYILGELVTEYAFSEILNTCKRFLKEKSLKVNSSAKEIELALQTHTQEINKWSNRISFNDLKKEKNLSDIFIDIDILLIPRKRQLNSDEKIETIESKKIFTKIENSIVILGQPGAGKTTLMKFLCQEILLNEDFHPELFRLPILIRLRDLNSSQAETNIITQKLFSICGIEISKEKKDTIIKDLDYSNAQKKLLYPLLESIKPLIILDGFDELSTDKLKEKVLEEFKELALSLNNGRIILTSRSSDYNYSIPNTSVLEISPLTDTQINRFVTKWLKEEDKISDFLRTLRRSPFSDTSIRPLTLSHLCAIYERSGKIPEKPKTIYRKIVNLLIEEWDEQRDVKRVSKYGSFETDRKFEFLARVAFEITTKYKETVFTVDQLQRIYSEIHIDFDLPKRENSKVIQELESHTGLLLQSGFQSFEFAHKSIQEYLCSEHLVRLPRLPGNPVVLKFIPNELAIATAISSDPSEYFCELVFNRLYNQKEGTKALTTFSSDFLGTFINRLVIEKPDFNQSNQVSYALVLLYTLLRNNDFGQLKLFETDLPIHFEKFVEQILLRNKKFSFNSFYEIRKEHKAEDKETVYELIKTDKGKSFTNIDFPMPNKIFVKKKFIENQLF